MSQQLIVNNNFYNGFTGWVNNAGVVIDPTQHIVNAQSIKIGPQASYHYLLQIMPALQANHIYMLQVWYQTDASFSATAPAAIALQGNATYTGLRLVGVPPSTPWTFLSHVWTQLVPWNGNSILISSSYGGSSTGNIWFDGLALTDMTIKNNFSRRS